MGPFLTSRNLSTTAEVVVSHPDARLTIHGRRLLVDRVRSGGPVHVDIKKLGNIPDGDGDGGDDGDGGGHRIMVRQQATNSRQNTTGIRRGDSPVIGYSFGNGLDARVHRRVTMRP